MAKNKPHPRLLNPLSPDRPSNFFYRLVSSQRFLAIIALVFLVLIMFPLARIYSQRLLVENEISELQKQIDDYEKKNQDLSGLLTYLNSEQAAEEAARLNLNLKKPGEGVIIIEGDKNVITDNMSGNSTETINNRTKWWKYFFN